MVPVYCPLCCDQPFEDQQTLFFHLRGIRNNLYCPICSERFASLEFLISHLSRKCLGPLSPPEAKKKCLPNADSGEKRPFAESFNNTKRTKLNNQTPLQKPHQLSVEPTSINNSSLAKAGLECTTIIPPEFRHKLSKSVTLKRLEPGAKNSEETKKCDEKQLSSSLENVRSSSICNKIPTVNDVSKDETHNKILTRSSECVKMGTLKQPEQKIKENPSLSITQIGPAIPNSSLNNIQSASATLMKTGPLSAKQFPKSIVTTRSSVKVSEFKKVVFNSEEEDIQDPKQRSSRLKVLNQPPGSAAPDSESSTSKVNIPTSQLETSTANLATTPKPEGRKRGRPPKYKRGKLEAPVLNIIVPEIEPEPKFILPDIIAESQIITPPLDQIQNSSSSMTCSKTGVITNKYINNIEYNDKKTKPLDVLSFEDNENSMGYDDFDEGAHQNDSFDSDEASQQEISETTGKEKMKDCDGTLKESSTIDRQESACSDIKAETDESELKTEEEEEYTCSACNMQFLSIYEHIKQYHNGEEVVVEVPEEEIKEDLKAYQNENENKPDIGDVESELNNKKSENNQLANNNLVFNTTLPSTSKESTTATCNSKTYIINNSNSCSKPLTKGKWVQSKEDDRNYYQFVSDQSKLDRLNKEFKDNDAEHSGFKTSIKNLYNNPKINIVEITYRPNTAYFTHKRVDFKKAIPMYVVERQSKESDTVLGGIASYIVTNRKENRLHLNKDSRVIAVMKVILASDKELSIENIVFKDKPKNENMIPILEDVIDPDIPLLEKGKMLKWMCTKCMTTTWKFPLTRDTHLCNACFMCHKPFATNTALRKHMTLHKEDSALYCFECHIAFSNKTVLSKHKETHLNHTRCPLCKLFVPKDSEEEHKQLHEKSPLQQFPCSVCQTLYASSNEVKLHETNHCSRLVAKFNCSMCNKKFFSLSALTNHTSVHKSVIIKYACKYCTKTFIKEKEQCPIKAGKRKPSAYVRKIWHERIHLRHFPFTCSGCPKRFRSLSHQVEHSLQAHHSTTQQDVPIHMCRVCDKCFHNDTQLSAHLLQHTPQVQA